MRTFKRFSLSTLLPRFINILRGSFVTTPQFHTPGGLYFRLSKYRPGQVKASTNMRTTRKTATTEPLITPSNSLTEG